MSTRENAWRDPLARDSTYILLDKLSACCVARASCFPSLNLRSRICKVGYLRAFPVLAPWLRLFHIHDYLTSVSFVSSHSRLTWPALDLAACWPDVWPYLRTLGLFQPLGPIPALKYILHLTSSSPECQSHAVKSFVVELER